VQQVSPMLSVVIRSIMELCCRDQQREENGVVQQVSPMLSVVIRSIMELCCRRSVIINTGIRERRLGDCGQQQWQEG
jgi:hypothetical protein